ncbi:MAG TPA: acetate kinase [Euzebyales bacterium]|nr:acetate kinase [Euzebyales bacterium]
MARVLVVNSGSSSLKYQLIETDGAERLAKGVVERIGRPTATATHGHVRPGDGWTEMTVDAAAADHHAALRDVVEVLRGAGLDTGIAAVGHRVVHGGDRFVGPTRVDDEVLDGIRALIPLAPLHNPANLTGIEVARRLWPQVPQVAVFDTAFHATLPPHAHRYAVPEAWYAQHRVRRYGFHGTSHAHVARRAATILERPLDTLRLITLHLGNGASVTAVDRGRSVDTSMGLTPLEGLVMGTRSGDIDPAIVFHIARSAGLGLDEIDDALNTRSGLLGLCGDNDLRTIEERAAAGDAVARLALDVFCHRIRRYIGAFAAVLGGVDALVFTAGIGEHSATVRARVCADLDLLGVTIDHEANAASQPSIGAPGSSTAVLVVPTDEELEIAVQTLATIGDG